MTPTLCICADKGVASTIKELITQQEDAQSYRVVILTSDKEVQEIKQSGEKLALLVFGPGAHAAMKELCDDYEQAERRVQLIYSFAAGVDALQLPKLARELRGIPFCNAQGCYSEILAEHVLFSMLYFNRSAWRLSASKAAKKWDRFNMVEVRGQKAVIFGYGSIGKACGKVAAALGMNVTGIRRSAPSAEVDENGVHVKSSDAADEAIRASDFVIGVLPGTDHTKHFFNKEVFSKMKPNAVFINIGRGITQCEADLVDALSRGQIRGAALDVFEQEPLPEDSPLWTFPDDKLLLSAHCADYSENIFSTSAKRFIGIVQELCKTGKVSAYQVDVTKGY